MSEEEWWKTVFPACYWKEPLSRDVKGATSHVLVLREAPEGKSMVVTRALVRFYDSNGGEVETKEVAKFTAMASPPGVRVPVKEQRTGHFVYSSVCDS